MSAATARRTNYGPGSTTATATLPAPAGAGIMNGFAANVYPSTPITSSSSTSSHTAAVAARAAFGASGPRSGYAGPSQPLRTAGDSWSLTRDGGKDVILIEDTPPPSTAASRNASTSTAAAMAAKRVKYNAPAAPSAKGPANGSGYALYDNNHVQAGPSNYLAHPDAAVNPSSRKLTGAKRKYNEVVDPAAREDAYSKTTPKPIDDKDGHFIVRENDELGISRRYKIIKLLGQGTFGKVVEAWDRDAQCTVAVKVIRAIQKYRDASKVEIKVLNLLRDRDPSNINKCIHLLDCFDYKNHICIVTKLLSSSVFDFLKDNNYQPFPMSHIQSFAKQLMTSVAFLHDLRLVHTDLKPENILLVDNDYVTVPVKATKAGHPKSKNILKNSNIHLIDFGSATFEEEYHASVVSTRHYRAPEIILGLGWSYPCDVWSIGCILVEFFTGEALFQTHENLEHLAMMEVVFGKVPETRWGKNAIRSKPEWFHQGTKINYPLPQTSRQSRKYVKAMQPLEKIVPPASIVHSRFLDLLGQLLKWDPAERMTVREALRHPFFSVRIEDEETRNIEQVYYQ